MTHTENEMTHTDIAKILEIEPEKLAVYTWGLDEFGVIVGENVQSETFTIYYKTGLLRKDLSAFDCAHRLRRHKDAGEIQVTDELITEIRGVGYNRLAQLVDDGIGWYDPINLPHEERFERVVDYVFGGKHHVRKFKVCHNGRHAYAEFTIYGGMSTVDFNKLTLLVIASHLYGVRAEIEPCNMQMLKIWLHARNKRDGSLSERCPDALELIEMIVDRAGKVVP